MGSHAEAGPALSGETARVRDRVARALVRHAPREAGNLDPDRVFAAASRHPFPAYLWGSPRWDKGRFAVVAHSPIATVRSTGGVTRVTTATGTSDFTGDPLSFLGEILPEPDLGPRELPFAGGAIGYITYEHALRYVVPGSSTPPGPLPDVHFAVYDRAYVYDYGQQAGYWIGPPGTVDDVPDMPAARLDGPWAGSVSRETYLAHVVRILEHIDAGDIYQANYTVRFEAPGVAHPIALALQMRRSIPTPMGACLSYPWGTTWSLSPERLWSGRRGQQMESRPIKGTRPRGSGPEQDERLAHELESSVKDRAELLMIVDLVRNDLGRVAPFGSVRVDRLFGVERYANVHHLEATVIADWPADTSWPRLLQAMLPGGSITGAPKRRAVEILRGLEPAPRSVYTGALGYISACGHTDFNLPIRTLYHDGSTFYLHSGSGIVADSDPAAEWDEVQVKVDNIRRLLAAT